MVSGTIKGGVRGRLYDIDKVLSHIGSFKKKSGLKLRVKWKDGSPVSEEPYGSVKNSLAFKEYAAKQGW